MPGKMYLSEGNHSVTVSVSESDKYSEMVYVDINRMTEDGNRPCNEFFLSPQKLDLLGRYFIRHAEEIRVAQEIRNKSK